MGSARTENRIFHGVAASPGIAIAQVTIADRRRVAVAEEQIPPDQIPLEIRRLSDSVSDAKEELKALKQQIAEQRGPEHLFVIDTHLMILEDAMLTEEASNFIANDMINAEGALKRTLSRYKEFFASIEDEYLRERSSDLETVIERVLRKLVGHHQEPLAPVGGKTIVVAHDLSPSDILQIDKEKVIGFITDLGGKTSHSAILARALEIPAVIGLENITAEILPGDSLVIDGSSGTVVINPNEDTFRDYLQRKQHYEYISRELYKLRNLPAETADGHRITLKGNVEFLEEVASVERNGGEGIGLYRTEMLFFNRSTLPTEEEQYEAYAAVIQASAPNPVSIRTLDVGGDKLVTNLSLEDEANPALGMRAIRLGLRQPEIFKAQLRAILRASALGKVRIFFPMISGVEEIRAVKVLLEEAKREVGSSGHAFDEEIEIGIMIEVPSAVMIADLLAREVDFFSVGTNDLIQYCLAIDRTNEHLSYLYEPLHPAVLRCLKIVVDAAHAAGIDACMCGEMAGDPEYLPILLGLGFDELSMNAVSIPKVKRILRRCTKNDVEKLADKALTFSTSSEVEVFLKSEIVAHYADSID